MLSSAIVLITAALILYTSGIWLEHRDGTLRPRHAVLFALGLACDTAGTTVMSRIAAAGQLATGGATGTLNRLMAITGAAALVLMALHLTWAIVVLVRDRAGERLTFHRFSLVVWAIWLVPYVAGMAASMLGEGTTPA